MINRLKTIVIYIALSCLGVLAGLILVEISLRLFPRDLLNSITEGSTRLQLYRLDPRIGWSLRPNARSLHTTRDDMTIQIETNSLGLRDTEHNYEKPSDVYRILMLGDSFTEALDVELKESFPYLVEQCLNQQLETRIEVINAGVSGYGAAEQYLFYTQEGIKYNPDLVVLVVYVGNDLSDLDRNDGYRMIRGFGGYRFSLEGGHLSRTWISWENPYSEQVSFVQLFLRRHSLIYWVLTHPESKISWNFAKKKEELLDWFQLNKVEQKRSQPVPWDLYKHLENFPNNPLVPSHLKEIWSVFLAIIDQLRTEVEDKDGQLAVAILPTEYQVHRTVREYTIKHFADEYEFGGLYERAWRVNEPNLTITNSLGGQSIPTLDLFPYFQAHDEAGGSLLYLDGDYPQHLNRDGQKLTGDIMCDWLMHNESIHLPRP